MGKAQCVTETFDVINSLEKDTDKQSQYEYST